MASLFRKNQSAFWFLKYRDDAGIWRMASTGLRADDPEQTAQARKIRALAEAKEHDRRARDVVRDGWDFADQFLRSHCKNPRTFERYAGAWKWIGLFLAEHRIQGPAALRYVDAERFVSWRVGFVKRHGKKQVCRNSALTDFKVLRLICGEAVRLGMINGSPLAAVKLKRDQPREKRRLADHEIQTIRRALQSFPEWMFDSFEIALHTGCRLRETQIPMQLIDIGRLKITFPSPKGGRARAFSVPIDDALIPTLERMKRDGRKVTCALPPFVSKLWRKFFDGIGLHDVSFHCLRVTRINKLFESNVPRELAMRLVNHSSEAVHKIYLRERIDDVMPFRNAVSFSKGEIPGE